MTKNRPLLIAYLTISIICLLIISFLLSPLCAQAKSSSKSGSADFTEGDNVQLGTLDGITLNWTILTYDSSTGVAFVVAKSPIKSKTVTDYTKSFWNVYPKAEGRPFETWGTSYWKSWLNTTFYNAAFNSNEKSKIKATSFTKDSEQTALMNLFHDTTLDAAYARVGSKYDMDTVIYDSQGASTSYVFFLSFDEYSSYKDTMVFSDEASAIWPLRTNSYYAKNRTSCVDESNGDLVEPIYNYCNTAIRPAMYVQLKKVDTTTTASTTSSTSSTSTSSTSSSSSTTTASTTSTSTTSSTTSTTSSSSSTSTGASASTVVSGRSYANNATNSTGSSGTINLPLDSDYTMSVGATAQVTMDLSYLNSTNKKYNVTYTSSDNKIFSVDSSGKITANKTGGAVLTVRMKKSNGKVYSMTCNVKVE